MLNAWGIRLTDFMFKKTLTHAIWKFNQLATKRRERVPRSLALHNDASTCNRSFALLALPLPLPCSTLLPTAFLPSSFLLRSGGQTKGEEESGGARPHRPPCCRDNGRLRRKKTVLLETKSKSIQLDVFCMRFRQKRAITRRCRMHVKPWR